MTPIVLSARAAGVLLAHWRDGAGGTAYDALADALRMLVIDGRVTIGARLPAERRLAETLGISRTTVATAYATLRDDGFIESMRGSGSVVRLPRGLDGRPDPERLAAVDPIGRHDPSGGVHGPDDARAGTRPRAAAAPAPLLDLRKAVVHAAPGIAEATERAMRHLPAALAEVGYDTVGDPGLRAAIADRYAERGLPTRPEQILVTLGAQHAIALLARVLVGRGDTVLVEAPTYPHAHEAFRAAGGRLVPVPVDAREGWDVTAMTTAIRRTAPAVAYVMPDLHNPTGATMSGPARDALLTAARDAGTVVVADETMGELRIDGPTIPPLGTRGPVVHIGSAGKVFWGALRIGWIRADADLLQRLVLARPTGDLGTPVIEQMVVRELVPHTASVLEERRRHLREGRDHVVAALRTRIPEWDVPSPDGGLTTWIGLGRPVSSALVLAARSEGVALASGGVFGPDGGFERFLRVPFSGAAADRTRMIDVLASAWRRVGGVEAGTVRSMAAVV
ncbi:PLP-dependent aminotransferase family protein [Curtobacterium sp. RRHDQ10]|uniref:MocR-like transcription factor YczR n=1 Tax=Curtobacterium phyllosphaerae TaxID=3413379 RepID=UPI003BF32BE2